MKNLSCDLGLSEVWRSMIEGLIKAFLTLIMPSEFLCSFSILISFYLIKFEG
jgi:hypothetical protein